MDESTLILIGVTAVAVLIVVLGVPLLYAHLYKKVAAGQAILVNRMSRVEVSFTGTLVIPTVHRAETVDISVKLLELDLRGKEGLICKDGIRADLKVTFFVRINRTAEDVIRVATVVGAERAGRLETLEELFRAKFSDGLVAVARELEFEQLMMKREEFKERVLEVIGEDLNGYVLDDLAIDYFEQTPVHHLDPNNMLDSAGIQKIVEITSARKIATSETERALQKRLRQLSVEAQEELIEIERRQADALGRLRADTGKDLTVEQLEDRVAARLREMVDIAVEERLAGG